MSEIERRFKVGDRVRYAKEVIGWSDTLTLGDCYAVSHFSDGDRFLGFEGVRRAYTFNPKNFELVEATAKTTHGAAGGSDMVDAVAYAHHGQAYRRQLQEAFGLQNHNSQQRFTQQISGHWQDQPAQPEPKRADSHAGPTAAQVREAYRYSIREERVWDSAKYNGIATSDLDSRIAAARVQVAREMQESTEERRRRLVAHPHPGRNFALERYK